MELYSFGVFAHEPACVRGVLRVAPTVVFISSRSCSEDEVVELQGDIARPPSGLANPLIHRVLV